MSNNSTISTGTGLPNGTISALIGQAPATLNDYYITKYLLLSFHETTDPMLGVHFGPLRPTDYVFATKGPRIITSMSISIFFMVLITGLRLGVRVFRRGLLVGLDDVFIVPGVLLAISWPILQICMVIYGGAGKHMYDVTYEEYGYFKTLANMAKLIFFVAVGVVKVSICLFNKRLTSMTSRSWHMFNNVFLFLLISYITIALFWNIFQCNPPYAGWNAIRIGQEGKAFKCTSDTILGSSLSVIHVVMDFGLLSVPLIVLWKVKMGWQTKSRLYFVFSIGAISCIGSIMRQIEQQELQFSDILWNYVPLQNWTLIDLSFGVVAASLPILSAFIPKRFKSHHQPTNPTPKYGGVGFVSKNAGGRSGYIRTSNSAERGFAPSGSSQENIIITDVIELSFQSKDERAMYGNEATSQRATTMERSRVQAMGIEDMDTLGFGFKEQGLKPTPSVKKPKK